MRWGTASASVAQEGRTKGCGCKRWCTLPHNQAESYWTPAVSAARASTSTSTTGTRDRSTTTTMRYHELLIRELPRSRKRSYCRKPYRKSFPYRHYSHTSHADLRNLPETHTETLMQGKPSTGSNSFHQVAIMFSRNCLRSGPHAAGGACPRRYAHRSTCRSSSDEAEVARCR